MQVSDLQFLKLEERADAIPRALIDLVQTAHSQKRFALDPVLDDVILRVGQLAEADEKLRFQLAGIPILNFSDNVEEQLISTKREASSNSNGTRFMDAIAEYMDDLAARQGAERNENISNLKNRSKMFVSLMGNLPLAEITNQTMRNFGYSISYLPAKTARRGSWDEESLLDILMENGFGGFDGTGPMANKQPVQKTISQKTIRSKILGPIITAMKFHAGNNGLQMPLQDFRFHLPAHTPRTKSRHRPSNEAVEALMERGLQDGRLVQACLPLLGRLTGRRLGLLAYLRCEHLIERDGHFLMSVPSQFQVENRIERAPVKNEVSTDEFALHDLLVEIGLVDFIQRRKCGWLFESLHLDGIIDPAAVAQRRCSRLASNIDMTFHQMRHWAKAEMRAEGISSEVIRMQIGHAALDEHERYGRKFEPAEVKKIATRRIEDTELIVKFKALDFQLAEKSCIGRARREMRRRKKSEKN